jgi:hypothetical protein
MLGLKGIFERSKKLTFNLRFSISAVQQIQERTLRKLLVKAMFTDFGKKYGFTDILSQTDMYDAFKSAVPKGDYMNMLPWWTRCRAGEEDVTWPGKVDYFALSSGTSDGSTKYIPVSRDMIRNIQRASIRQVLSVARTDVPKDHMLRDWLMIGGSTQLDYNGTYYSGDLSGITTGNIPLVFQRNSKPEPEIKNAKDWNEKLEKITQEAGKWNVGMVAGVPAWILILFERIIEHHQVDNIHQIWPNLEVFVHGGVSIKPYKHSIDKLLGRPIKYFETYLASEGFIAFQSRAEAVGMRMLLRSGIFYEFVPFTDENFTDGEMNPNAETLPIWKVEEGVNYALLMSTCSGAWRYLIGDTVRFTDLERQEIEITGRTKHYISMVGEHLSVDNMNCALEKICIKLNAEINEFTVMGIPYQGRFAHQWYIGYEGPKISEAEFSVLLDNCLGDLNDDYRVERQHALKEVLVTFLPNDAFIEFLKTKGKVGAQHKFPRVMKGTAGDEWLAFVKGYQNRVKSTN